MLAFGRDIPGDFALAEVREWLCTNGFGGFASGTIAGSLARSYHGLLVAVLDPPLGRTLLGGKLEETGPAVWSQGSGSGPRSTDIRDVHSQRCGCRCRGTRSR